jgi:hypothetical protein
MTNESPHATRGALERLLQSNLLYTLCRTTQRLPILPYILGPLLTSHLAKDLQESPHPNPTENRYRQVIIPSKDINHLASRCYESCP